MEVNDISALLSRIEDPHSGQSIVSLGLVRELTVDDQGIHFKLINKGWTPEMKTSVYGACMQVIQNQYGGDQNVHIHFVQEEASQSPTSPYPHIKNIIAVASGKGGVGKSTISVNLAYGLQAMGAKVGLMDADLYGPSIPTMLGLQGKRPKMKDLHGTPKLVPLEAYGLPTISIGFIVEPEQAVVLRGPRLGGIIKQFMNDVIWPELDFLIIDLPPGTGDIQLTLVQTVPVTGVVLVTTPQEVAVVDAVKAMNMFLLPQIDVPILGVVENMSWFTPEELPDHQYKLFGEGGGKKLAQLSDSVLLAQIPLVMGIREGGDRGLPAVLQEDELLSAPMMDMAKNLFTQVNIRNEKLAPTRKVEISV